MILIDGASFVHCRHLSLRSPLRCEYILYRGLYRTSYARVSRGVITDTELQIGQFVLPKHGHDISDDSVTARYIRSKKEDLPEDHVSFLPSCSWSLSSKPHFSGSRRNIMETKTWVGWMVISTMYSTQYVILYDNLTKTNIKYTASVLWSPCRSCCVVHC